jgi:hypothetical protein
LSAGSAGVEELGGEADGKEHPRRRLTQKNADELVIFAIVITGT